MSGRTSEHCHGYLQLEEVLLLVGLFHTQGCPLLRELTSQARAKTRGGDGMSMASDGERVRVALQRNRG